MNWICYAGLSVYVLVDAAILAITGLKLSIGALHHRRKKIAVTRLFS